MVSQAVRPKKKKVPVSGPMGCENCAITSGSAIASYASERQAKFGTDPLGEGGKKELSCGGRGSGWVLAGGW